VATDRSGSVTFTATTALPYEHLERATAGLRAERRRQLLHVDVHRTPVWETLMVTGPHMFTDLRGRVWFEYRATVEPVARSTAGNAQVITMAGSALLDEAFVVQPLDVGVA
jgi:hypothetical protein